ncbi:hypothetical protein LZZ90_03945 [Flavobacterium sp. SM15]|uniref:hypothetical protein n=1 Tax=Flavobacterium sp. SM15 TaxID=2908005 RepID=UPI001EDA02C7|nr:hypothetical protein [Flavobacterium sp. SM15]MCG2610653.1 hypothetical protein [Flavobacterium sp. SM15]
MQEVKNELVKLFESAKAKNEFEFVQVLMNYKGMGSLRSMSNLYEWFDALDFYNSLYEKHTGIEKYRIGCLIYSTFFESSDFYNIIGSLCRIEMGFRSSSYLFFKTKKYERLLGTGEKIGMISELLEDSGNDKILSFFSENHFKEIRNTFFHSAYTIIGEDYQLFDSEPIVIDGIGRRYFDINEFLLPKISNVLEFFYQFKECFFSHFASYKENKVVNGNFPNPVIATILGSNEGLKGFKMEKTVQFYGEWHDSGIFYDDNMKMWTGMNIRFNFPQKETIEIDETLQRYENKPDIKNQNEFWNLTDKIIERNDKNELLRILNLLAKYGDVRYQKWYDEENSHKKEGLKKYIKPFYEKALEIKLPVDFKSIRDRMKEIEN